MADQASSEGGDFSVADAPENQPPTPAPAGGMEALMAQQTALMQVLVQQVKDLNKRVEEFDASKAKALMNTQAKANAKISTFRDRKGGKAKAKAERAVELVHKVADVVLVMKLFVECLRSPRSATDRERCESCKAAARCDDVGQFPGELADVGWRSINGGHMCYPTIMDNFLVLVSSKMEALGTSERASRTLTRLGELTGKAVRLYYDNQAVVGMLSHFTSRNPELMRRMRCLCILLDLNDIELQARYIKSEANECGDRDLDDWRLNRWWFLWAMAEWHRHTVD
eukprot:gene34331-biopygen25932